MFGNSLIYNINENIRVELEKSDIIKRCEYNLVKIDLYLKSEERLYSRVMKYGIIEVNGHTITFKQEGLFDIEKGEKKLLKSIYLKVDKDTDVIKASFTIQCELIFSGVYVNHVEKSGFITL